MKQLANEIRAMGNPLVAIYALAYLTLKARENIPKQCAEVVLEAFNDFLFHFKEVRESERERTCVCLRERQRERACKRRKRENVRDFVFVFCLCGFIFITQNTRHSSRRVSTKEGCMYVFCYIIWCVCLSVLGGWVRGCGRVCMAHVCFVWELSLHCTARQMSSVFHTLASPNCHCFSPSLSLFPLSPTLSSLSFHSLLSLFPLCCEYVPYLFPSFLSFL